MPPGKRPGAPARKVARRRRVPSTRPTSSKRVLPPRKQPPPPREADPFAKKTGRRRTYYTAEFLAEAKRRVEQTDEKPDLTTKEGRVAAILDLFAIRGTWHQHEMLEHLAITRSTLQRDLDSLVKQQRLLARGATKNRVYSLPKPDRDR